VGYLERSKGKKESKKSGMTKIREDEEEEVKK
jgi:hypothetical protein